MESYYKNNLKDGVETGYYESGEIKDFGIYSAGKKNGKFYNYHPNGLIKKEMIFSENELISSVEYDERGLKIH